MDEREHYRFIVDREIDCFFKFQKYKGFLYDLSVSGCMVELPAFLFPIGAKIDLRLNGFIEVRGEVVWKLGGHCGVRFSQILHEAAVKYLGFTPEHKPFEVPAFTDRFGRLLPPLPLR